jgi:hypothetical protein
LKKDLITKTRPSLGWSRRRRTRRKSSKKSKTSARKRSKIP